MLFRELEGGNALGFGKEVIQGGSIFNYGHAGNLLYTWRYIRCQNGKLNHVGGHGANLVQPKIERNEMKTRYRRASASWSTQHNAGRS